MADCILLIYLHLIQVAAISKLLPSSVLEDAAKIQTSKKKLVGKDVQQRNSPHTLLVGIYIGLTMSEYIPTKAKHSSHDTAIPLLGIYPREMRAYVHQKTCTTIMFKAAENNPNVHEENGYIMAYSYNGIPQSNKELLTGLPWWRSG